MAHLFVQAQMEKEHSVWGGLGDLALNTVTFAAVMSVLDPEEVCAVVNDDTKRLMKKVGDNTRNIVFGPDVVPRGYAYCSYIYDVLEKCAPEVLRKQGGILRLARVPISNKALKYVQENFRDLVKVMVKYRHQGKLLYYKDENAEEPRILTDHGPDSDQSDPEDDSLLIYYKLEDYNITGATYVETLGKAHSYFPMALASYVSQESMK